MIWFERKTHLPNQFEFDDDKINAEEKNNVRNFGTQRLIQGKKLSNLSGFCFMRFVVYKYLCIFIIRRWTFRFLFTIIIWVADKWPAECGLSEPHIIWTIRKYQIDFICFLLKNLIVLRHYKMRQGKIEQNPNFSCQYINQCVAAGFWFTVSCYRLIINGWSFK